MLLDVARLMMGLVLMAFHRQIADHIVALDHTFLTLLRASGLRVPEPPRASLMHTFYFCLGMFVCVLSMARLYTLLPK